MDNLVTTFYNDDIMVFTPQGKPVNLPKRATALDFAFEIHSEIGAHAHYARINGQLSSIKTELHRGDVVEIVTNPNVTPQPDWIDYVLTYKAKGYLKRHNARLEKPEYSFCKECHPIPGEEVVGFRNPDGTVTVHRRNCPIAIRLASQHGDSIVSVDYKENPSELFPVKIQIAAVDRYHLLSDIINCITDELQLSIDVLHTTTTDCIVDCSMEFGVHSYNELQTAIVHISAIENVEEEKNLQFFVHT